MLLELQRRVFTEQSTIGKLAVNGVFECFTLEDKVREPFVKVPGKTAIPSGTYTVTVNWSQRFNRMMPLLMNVPQFEGVRIHSGNTAADTEGCILVGKYMENDKITASRLAFDALFDKIDKEFGRGQQITISIASEAPNATT